jgi:hypothetical protein
MILGIFITIAMIKQRRDTPLEDYRTASIAFFETMAGAFSFMIGLCLCIGAWMLRDIPAVFHYGPWTGLRIGNYEGGNVSSIGPKYPGDEVTGDIDTAY